jgi:pyridinium-3,5-bisthiocarboxylic acid mononucleotide nickel chelatase
MTQRPDGDRNVLRFDSVGGASGNMILGALIGLGVDPEWLNAALQSLDIEPFTIRAEPAEECGWSGIRVTVDVPDHHHPHRHLSAIRALIESAPLPRDAARLAVAVFERLADAEAAVHNTTPERIHFHEVGAMDAILDIVGACLAVDRLGVQAVAVGPLPVGRGTVECAHGVLPVPVPAVLHLLRDHPVLQTDEPCELVTPTGAAVLTTLAALRPAGGAPPLYPARSACGLGTRALQARPNLLRATLLHPADAAGADTCLVLECNLDDTLPEWLGAVMERVLAAGALDVFMTPVQMKKQRPGTLLSVLCRPDDRGAMLDLLFSETTTFGVRAYSAERTLLARRHVSVDTPYGAVRVKVGTWRGRDVTRAPEFDDCRRCAEAHGVPVRRVYDAALRALS